MSEFHDTMFPHITNKLTIQAENSAQWKGKKISHLCDQVTTCDPYAKRDGRPQVNPLFNFLRITFRLSSKGTCLRIPSAPATVQPHYEPI